MTAGVDSPVVDFTSLDQASSFADIVAFARRTFPTRAWTSFNVTNFATFQVELLSYCTDLLAYNQNRQIIETVLAMVRRMRNFRNIAKGFDFVPYGPSASEVSLRVFLPDPATSTYAFTISKYQLFLVDGIYFEPTVDIAVDSSVTVSGPDTNGDYYQDITVYSGKTIVQEVLGTSNGQPGQTFQTAAYPVIDGTLSVTAGGADSYTEVVNLLLANATSKSYTVSDVDDDRRWTLRFGDGTFGMIPPTGRQMLATYRVGGGSSTNVAAGSVMSVGARSDGGPVSTVLLTASTLTLADGSGGDDPQTLANAKRSLPLALAANDRGVTVDDYAAIASNVSGVKAVSGVVGRGINNYPPFLVIVPGSGGSPSAGLLNQVFTLINQKKSAGRKVRGIGPNYVTFLISVDVTVKSDALASSVGTLVRGVLNAAYGFDSMTFSPVIKLQDAYELIKPSAIRGLSGALYREFRAKEHWGKYIDRGTNGNGDVRAITVDLPTVKQREWNIRVLPPSAPYTCRLFEVRQRILGTVSFILDNYVSDTGASLTPGEMNDGTWELKLNPSEDDVPTFAISANTQQSISTSDYGLLVYGQPNDKFAAEKLEKLTGKILKSTVTSTVSALSVPVNSITDWEVGDLAVVYNSSGEEVLRGMITSLAGGMLTFTETVNVDQGGEVVYLWRSVDESVNFAVYDGTQPWQAGDQMYVDTYPATGNVTVRGEDFLLCDPNVDITVNTIGGI